MSGWLAIPREWLTSMGEISRFCLRVMGLVYSGRVFQFFGEALRQAGILIISSTLVIWGLVFIIGLQCGIEGAYFTRSVGAPAYAGNFAAWCDLREVIPYAFGYMMSAKIGTGIVAELGAMRISDEIDALEVMGIQPVTFLAATRLLAAWCDLREIVPYGFGYMMAAKVGTGIVAELGSMRISDEIDALEVMGIDSVLFLCATKLLASWLVLPFMYMAAVGAGFFASYLAVVQQIGEVSPGGFSLIFWMFQNPPDLLYSIIKAMTMATAIVLVGCYYGYHAGGGPVGVGTATAKSMVMNIVLVHLIGMLGTQVFWGANPRAPIGG